MSRPVPGSERERQRDMLVNGAICWSTCRTTSGCVCVCVCVCVRERVCVRV